MKKLIILCTALSVVPLSAMDYFNNLSSMFGSPGQSRQQEQQPSSVPVTSVVQGIIALGNASQEIKNLATEIKEALPAIGAFAQKTEQDIMAWLADKNNKDLIVELSKINNEQHIKELESQIAALKITAQSKNEAAKLALWRLIIEQQNAQQQEIIALINHQIVLHSKQ